MWEKIRYSKIWIKMWVSNVKLKKCGTKKCKRKNVRLKNVRVKNMSTKISE